jgi:hypothetical protein
VKNTGMWRGDDAFLIRESVLGFWPWEEKEKVTRDDASEAILLAKSAHGDGVSA